MQFSPEDKPEISYPCIWGYRVIGTDSDRIRSAIAGIVGDLNHNVSKGNVSSKGTYCSVNVEVSVESEEHRNELFAALAAHDDVKMVI